MHSLPKIFLPVFILVLFTGTTVFLNQPALAIPLQKTEGNLPDTNDLEVTTKEDIPHAIFIADKHLKYGNYQEVIATSSKILSLDHDHIEAHAYLAAAYKGLNNKEKSEEEIALVKKLSPKSPVLSKTTAALYLSLGDKKEAELTYKNGINEFSDNAELIMALATLYRDEGRTQEAEEQFRKVLEKKNLPTQFFLNANFALCRIELEEKAYDAAIKRARILTELYPPVPQGHQFLGAAYIGNKEPEKAVKVYEDFIKINPDLPLSYQELALIYNDTLGNREKGLSYAQEAIRKFPENAKSQDLLGWIFLQDQKFPEALKHFQKATRIELGNPVYLYHLGLAYQEMQEKRLAVKAFEQALIVTDQNPANSFVEELKNRINQCK